MFKYITMAILVLTSLLVLPQRIGADDPIIVVIPKVLSIQENILKYAEIYNVSHKQLLTVAKCESQLNPKAHNKNDPNGGSRGIFQFQTSTFNRYSSILKIEEPDIWNSEQQIKVAAYMFSKGQQKQWTCYRNIYKKSIG